MGRHKRSFAQEICVKSVGKAVHKTGMLRPGCRVGVAVTTGNARRCILNALTRWQLEKNQEIRDD
ncbi:MAG: hypothetical protein LBQ10_00515 [Desulfovibrio sp.]|nr:hypothetical protein [Desulfovibrio sp.]